MMNNNYIKWKLFKLSDVFVIEHGFYNKKPEHTIVGKIPFLSSIDANNGVSDYYSLTDIEQGTRTGDTNNEPISKKIFKKDAVCITNNGSVGFAYYQDKPFTCSHDVTPIYIKNGAFNYFSAMFVCTVIMGEKYRWAYGRKWRPKRMQNSTIYLPYTLDESNKSVPDWNYMENYIKSLNIGFPKTSNKTSKIKFQIEKWKSFYIKDIFTIRNGLGITTEEIEDHKGSFPAVQSGAEKNGIIGYIDLEYCKSKNYCVEISPCLTVARSGSSGFISLQPKGCVVGDSAKILKLKDKKHSSIYILIFLRTILLKLMYKYAYERKVTEDKYYEEIISLPVTQDNNPDWQFMENYIKSLPYGDCI